MTIRIIHGGQTGVDRGAHRGALEAGFAIGGFAPTDCRDESGLIPNDVLQHLEPLASGGYSIRSKLNVQRSNALLVVVEDAEFPYRTPGTKATLEYARYRGWRPREEVLVVDGSALYRDFARTAFEIWLRALSLPSNVFVARPDVFDLMIAGPRASLWPDGERVTMSLVDHITRVVPPSHA